MERGETILLREVTYEDCDDLFRWRNDEQARKASFNSGPILYETHKDWFGKALENPDRHIYVGEEPEGGKIGVVRLDKVNEQVVEFNIVLAPEMRGKGYGAKLIEQAGQLFRRANKGNIFIARAKKDNPASIKVFVKAGFFEMFDYVEKGGGKVVVLGFLAKQD